MGKQRSKVLRRKAEEIFKMLPEKFSPDFGKNKLALQELNLFSSKTDRDIVAGVITNLSKRAKQQ